MAPQKHILVIEDNEINRAMLCGILSSQYAVLEAENGEDGLRVLREQGEDISLILLDIVMPVMDGYTFLSIVKSDPAYSSIPVIVTTQSDQESDEVTALSHGATDFVAKPYKPQVILHRVAGIIHLRETAAMINQFQYDRLTGLYSKEFFCRRANELLLQHPDQEYDLICSDVENFKLINDVFGLPAGDRLLCGIARQFASKVAGRGICGRFNADQFVCLLERSWTYTDEMFRQAIHQVNSLSNAKNVVMKWGVYQIHDRTVSMERMCDRALLAARSIKGQYQKLFAIYDDELRSKMLREQSITDSMESALAKDQFVVYLQPKYSLKTGWLSGVEALVRWEHPEWGLLMPGEFIPLFEKNGFITKMDQYIWEKACALLRAWQDKNWPSIPISVNVSRADVYQTDLAELLLSLVTRYGLDPSSLHLEITESAYTEDPDQIIRTVTHLRELGFIIEMDDFGSGYSSLNMLNQMPLDILKLDMKFIQSETAKPADQGILRFIMGLARWMGLEVVAEGVETSDQLERLQEIGCDYVQGYYFARPMPCRDFEELILTSVQAQTSGAAETEPDQAPAQILLVADEDPVYRAQVRETFGGRYQVEEAADGEAALACIAGSGGRLAAVLLSLTLSGPDGFSILERLQCEKLVWNIPVVATGPAGPELEEKALALGADDFAGKPHGQKALWTRVMRVTGFSSAQARERVLQDEAYRDYLTGLLNRRGLTAAVESLGEADAPLAVYLFDLDNLKEINDTFGHGAGDRVLQEFSRLLALHTRGSDILSRFGGDEFVVIMKQMGAEETALKKGEKICRAFRESSLAEKFRAACSVGIIIHDRPEHSVSGLIELADRALYRAKSGNKGGGCVWA